MNEKLVDTKRTQNNKKFRYKKNSTLLKELKQT